MLAKATDIQGIVLQTTALSINDVAMPLFLLTMARRVAVINSNLLSVGCAIVRVVI